MRTDMNRLDLLTACRRAAAVAPANARRRRSAESAALLASGDGDGAAAGGWDPYGHHILGAPVQLRDIRCLQARPPPAVPTGPLPPA